MMRVFEEMICVHPDKNEIFLENYRYAMYPAGGNKYAVLGNMIDSNGIVYVYKNEDERFSADIENEDEAVFVEYLKSEQRQQQNKEAIENLEKECMDILGDNMMGKMFGQLTKSMTAKTMKNMGASKEETKDAMKELENLWK